MLNVGQVSGSANGDASVPVTFSLTPAEVLKVSYAESFAEKVRLSLIAPNSGPAAADDPPPYRADAMIRILLAINDARLADHLSGLVAESDELQIATMLRDPQELRGALPRQDVDAVLVHDRLGALPLIEVVREVTVAHPDLGLVMIVAEGSQELLRSGMQAGARDVIAQPIGLEQLETSVMAAAAWTHAVRRRAARETHGELIGSGGWSRSSAPRAASVRPRSPPTWRWPRGSSARHRCAWSSTTCRRETCVRSSTCPTGAAWSTWWPWPTS